MNSIIFSFGDEKRISALFGGEISLISKIFASPLQVLCKACESLCKLEVSTKVDYCTTSGLLEDRARERERERGRRYGTTGSGYWFHRQTGYPLIQCTIQQQKSARTRPFCLPQHQADGWQNHRLRWSSVKVKLVALNSGVVVLLYEPTTNKHWFKKSWPAVSLQLTSAFPGRAKEMCVRLIEGPVDLREKM